VISQKKKMEKNNWRYTCYAKWKFYEIYDGKAYTKEGF
jgi:hypothetical protein